MSSAKLWPCDERPCRHSEISRLRRHDDTPVYPVSRQANGQQEISMNELQNQARRLRAQIQEAFADVPYPGDDNLWEGGQRDDDYDDVIRNLTGKHWKDLIPKRKPPKGRSHLLIHDLIFCSPAAWHFFLPAYLIADLMRDEINALFFEPRDRPEPKFDRLNMAQRSAVVSFLGYAGLLLNDKQEKLPQHVKYFERQRQELASVAAYWNSRTASL